jgi:hypothetical protein
LKDPKVEIEEITTVIKPAAGPETPSRELLNKPTTTPPMIPAIKPEIGIGVKPSTEVEANPIPKHKGSATKNTTILEGRSSLHDLKRFFKRN